MRKRFTMALVLLICFSAIATGSATPALEDELTLPAATQTTATTPDDGAGTGIPAGNGEGGEGSGAVIDALIIDTAGIYDGMNMSYDSGYKPEIKDDTINIILPLIVNRSSGAAALEGNKITVVPNLGSATDTPFIFEGVHMQAIPLVGKVGGSTGGSAPNTYFLLNLPVKLKAERAGGDYSINLAIDYTVSGQDFAHTQYVTFTVPVSAKGTGGINTPNGEGEGGGDGTGTITPPDNGGGDTGGGGSFTGSGGGASGGGGGGSTGSARLMLEEFQISSDPVLAGEEFDITIKLKNTSAKALIRNLIVTFTGETVDIVTAGNTDSVFLKQIKANGSESVTMRMKVRQEAEAKPQKVAIAVAGEDKDGTGITENLSVLVDIKQPNRIDFDEAIIEPSVNAGDTISISLNVINKGRSTLNNVMVKLDAPGLFPEGSAFLGNMESGTSKTAELMAFVGTLDMPRDSSASEARSEQEEDEAGFDEDEGIGADMDADDDMDAPEDTDEAVETDGEETTAEPDEIEEPEMDMYMGEKYGPTSGYLVVTYEDNYGEEFTEEVELSTVISEPDLGGMEEMEEPEEPKKASQWWVSVLIAAGVILVVVAGILIMRKRRMDRITAEDDAD